MVDDHPQNRLPPHHRYVGSRRRQYNRAAYGALVHPNHSSVNQSSSPAPIKLTTELLNQFAEQANGDPEKLQALIEQAKHPQAATSQAQATAPQAPVQQNLGQLKASTAQMPSEITYTYTVGEDKTRYFYRAGQQPDGTIAGEAYVVGDHGQITKTEISKSHEAMLKEFAAKDIGAGKRGALPLSSDRIRRMDADINTDIAEFEKAIITLGEGGNITEKQLDVLCKYDLYHVIEKIKDHPELSKKYFHDNKACEQFINKYIGGHPADDPLCATLRKIGYEPAPQSVPQAAPSPQAMAMR